MQIIGHLRAAPPPDNFTDDSPAQSGQAQNQDGSSQSLSFADIIDAINPLQHIPIISSIYRALTGDEISPAARIAGDAIYGGPIGLVSGVANSIIENETGKDIGANVIAAVSGDTPQPVQLASAVQPTDGTADVAAIDTQTVDKAPLVRVSANNLPVAEYQWEEVSRSIPESSIASAPQPPAAPAERLPWLADAPAAVKTVEADNSLSPLPWIAAIGALPPSLPANDASVARSYAPYPAAPSRVASKAIDFSA